jgi:hypothetical protein
MPKLHLAKRLLAPAAPLDVEDSTYLLSMIYNALYVGHVFG